MLQPVCESLIYDDIVSDIFELELESIEASIMPITFICTVWSPTVKLSFSPTGVE